MVKRAAAAALSARDMGRTHAEFKDAFGLVYRGAAFALVGVFLFAFGRPLTCGCCVQRKHIATRPLLADEVDRFVMAHVRMYIDEAAGCSCSCGVEPGGCGCEPGR